MKNSDNNPKYLTSGVAKRTFLGSGLTILAQGITVLQHVVLVPLFLSAWGKLSYGEWLTIYAFVGYLPLLDMGVLNYVGNRLAQSYSKGDLEEYNKIFQSSLRLYLTIVILSSPVFIIFTFLFPFTSLLNFAVTNETVVKITCFILGEYALFGIPSNILIGLYRSLGEYPRQAILLAIRQILLISFLVGALLLRGGFMLVAAVNFIPLVCLVAFILFDINRRHPEISFGFSCASWSYAFKFIGPSLLFLAITFANILRNHGSFLVVNSILGAAAVAIFSIHRTLANFIYQIVSSITHALWPELTAIYTREEFGRAQQALGFLVKFSLFISFSFVVFLYFSGRSIINIWTQNRVEFQPVLWLTFLIYLPLNVFWESIAIFQISTNKHKKYALAKIFSAISGIILSVFLTKIWGLAGLIVALIIVESLICLPFIPAETLHIVRADKRDFWLNTVGKSFIIIAVQVPVALILSRYISNISLRLVSLIIGIFAVGALASHIFWLNKKEKEFNLRILKRIQIMFCQNQT